MDKHADTWDADTYDRYKDERQKPFFDLMALVRPSPELEAVDLGCGTGELTRVLHTTLGAARTLGLDRSVNMLKLATAHLAPGLTFSQGDIADFGGEEEYALIFSNAALQWLPGHPALLAQLWRALKPGGQLAVQLPANQPHATQRAAADVAAREPYAAVLHGQPVAPGSMQPEQYAEILYHLGAVEQHVRLQIYTHELPDEGHAFGWVRGTLLTGYESALGEELYARFEQDYRARLRELIPPQSPYLLTYRRILFWARKG